MSPEVYDAFSSLYSPDLNPSLLWTPRGARLASGAPVWHAGQRVCLTFTQTHPPAPFCFGGAKTKHSILQREGRGGTPPYPPGLL